jgi:hypothetical protein
MGTTISPENDARTWLRQAAFEIVGRLGAQGAEALIHHARMLREERLDRGSLIERLRVAVPLALVPPLRRLGVTGRGPEHVWALPFEHVLAATDRCVDLYVPGHAGVDYTIERTQRSRLQVLGDGEPFGVRSLYEWTARHKLQPWLVDGAAWSASVQRAQRAATAIDLDAAANRLQRRTVVWAHTQTVPSGPRDGAPGLELIFDDGQALIVPVSQLGDGAGLVGGHVDATNRAGLVFASRAREKVVLAVSHRAALVHQPSPLPTTG